MESIGRQRRDLEWRSGGFTLLEVTVVVLVVGILLAVGLPLFVGAQQRAKDTAAKARADTALKAQRSIYADARGFGDDAALEDAEPTLDARPLADGEEATVQGAVYVRDVSATGVVILSRSGSGECYWAKQEPARVLYAKGSCDEDDIDTLTFANRWP